MESALSASANTNWLCRGTLRHRPSRGHGRDWAVSHLPVMLLQFTLNPLPLFLIDKGFYSRFPL
jgi:hypothetical protein